MIWKTCLNNYSLAYLVTVSSYFSKSNVEVADGERTRIFVGLVVVTVNALLLGMITFILINFI